MRRNLIVALAFLAVLFVGGWTPKKSQQNWEYRFVLSPTEKKANELGSEGWEIIAINGGNFPTYVFKRQR